jgi:DNA mismatch endonuclease (patch repair protein)
MSDIFSKYKRSDIMSKISGKETKPEILVRKYLFSKGFRYRKNVKELPGKPDIVLPKYRTIIFIHGCFGMLTKVVRSRLCRQQTMNFGKRN